MATESEPWWKPEQLARRQGALEARGRMVRGVRGFFEARAFAEVETPALQASPGMEAHLRAFRTELREPFGQGRRALYLHTSPEFAMKKLLAGGMERIFQIARVFRNEERSGLHHPEFTLLEWYRAGATLADLMDECEALVRACADAAGTTALTWQGRASDPRLPWRRLSVADAFREYAGFDVLALAGDVPGIRRAAKRIGITPGPRDDWDDIFFRVFLEKIEMHLGVPAPTILHGYPASMAALAKLDERDPRVAERFEVYVAGMELANAFAELTDPVEQRRRFEVDNAKREKLFGERYPVDADFIAALEAGLPAAAGIALGFDRLVMLATGAETIEDVLWAPVAK
ncbi:MAG: EF-P lysine aminoacylase GenX [Rhodospirillales bacterium]|nr:EF-P lysine aminoacylase GenX [Rhodospirillales bacterium]MSP79492.1 EF-P lysine aminoacylase GenX [Rhodospirillales bacterium]